ncbi:MAG TPA: hypothetical protein VIJ72_04180 [Rhizomicrobium sp.]
MPVPSPTIRWPTELREDGPAEDPEILLMGKAEVAGAAFRVMALRVRQDGRTPDYRDGVPDAAYDSGMDAMVGDIEDLADSIGPRLIPMNGAQYLLWMVPSAPA